MNSAPVSLRLAPLGVIAALLFGSTAWAAEKTTDSKPAYPLTTCVVSDEKLGEMGDAIDYVYQEPGKPDRLVRFCCKHCVKDFKKDPAKYLKKLDDAAAAAAKASPPAKK